jgi:hypothetical protein
MYVCSTAFEEDPDFEVFESIELLKQNRSCWKECGILEVEIYAVKEVVEGVPYQGN